MTTGEKVGIGVALLLLFWPWKEDVTTTVGPPIDYGPSPTNGSCTNCTPFDPLQPDPFGFQTDPFVFHDPFSTDPFTEQGYCGMWGSWPCLPGNTYGG